MKYDLVFEGGGAKGMVFVGACQEFFRRGYTFDRLLGTSAGAITAALLAAGYTPDEMLAALLDKSESGESVFNGFMGSPLPFSQEELSNSATLRLLDGIDFTLIPNWAEKRVHEELVTTLAGNSAFRHILSLIERGGWYSADKFVTWLRKKLDSGSWRNGTRAFSEMTMQQFFDATGVELSLITSNITEGIMLVLNHRTAPDCPIVWAVRMSMSIPLVWNEVIWEAGWGQYRGRDLTGNTMVDGGLLSNFPIELFISDAPPVIKLMGPKKDNPVLGLLIDENLPVAKGLFVKINIKPGELKTVQRLRQLADTVTGAHDKAVIDEYSNLVARLPAQGYGTTEFDMTDERREALVRAGAEAMALYFDTPSGLLLPTKGVGDSKMVIQTTADRIAATLLEENRP
jgi:NTE family protein